LLAALGAASAHAQPLPAGTATRGGSVSGGQVIHVTTLADSGPGSLRAAVQAQGPRVVVFDVAGIIQLQSDLKLSVPNLTIAGQTAPRPGVTLTSGSLRVRTHDVILQHIAIRPGRGSDPDINGNRDSITIGGGKNPASDVRVENVSTTWSIDENIDVESPTTHNVTLRNCLVAEALRNAGHPKGEHSMGMLINDGPQGVAITGNLFVSNMYRNPVLARGAVAFVGYNYIVNPGHGAIHFYSNARNGVLRVAVVGNVVDNGNDTSPRLKAVQLPDDMALQSPDAQIYLADNTATNGPLMNDGGFRLTSNPPVALAVPVKPPGDVRAFALKYAGSRPGMRDSVDARIVAEARGRTTDIIDDPSQVGGWPQVAPVKEVAAVPGSPFEPSGIDGLLRIEAWLCERHLEVGGPNTPECPHGVAEYRNVLLKMN
jgi:hypothetical protein